MFILLSLILIAGGVMAAYPMIVQKQPNARDLLDRLMPYQSIMGVVLLVVGAIWVLKVVANINTLFSPGWLLMFASLACSVGLGFLMGYNMLIKTALSGNADASKKAENLRQKLLAYQIPLGFGGIGVGLLSIIYSLA